mgnify:CR=1 FL=1
MGAAARLTNNYWFSASSAQGAVGGTAEIRFCAAASGRYLLTPAAPAVANAVADAIGVRIHDLPITPERVLEALEAERE